MKKGSSQHPPANVETTHGISAIAVEGYKSLRQRTEIAVRPLTLLAGPNGSGKSSVMQGPLLLKQTLEASYDPGALLLDGPHVRFTAAEQLLPRSGGKTLTHRLAINVRISDGEMVDVCFEQEPGLGFDVVEMSAARPAGLPMTLRRAMTESEAFRTLPPWEQKMAARLAKRVGAAYRLGVNRERCFLRVGTFAVSTGEYEGVGWADPLHHVHRYLRAILHVPALRGNPVRTYRTTAVGGEFSGTFEPYVASVINHWQASRDPRLEQLGNALSMLGLTWKIEAKRIDDTQVELRAGRLGRPTRGGAKDLVSIADMGFGLSQTLPVVVALLTAQPGQLVYVEQPEIHLHPRAQVAFARILAESARRGVHVVAETHSALLLSGVQGLVAEGALSPREVALHWFSQTTDGATCVRSADLDRTGAFGDWPEEFDEDTLRTQVQDLLAPESRPLRR